LLIHLIDIDQNDIPDQIQNYLDRLIYIDGNNTPHEILSELDDISNIRSLDDISRNSSFITDMSDSDIELLISTNEELVQIQKNLLIMNRGTLLEQKKLKKKIEELNNKLDIEVENVQNNKKLLLERLKIILDLKLELDNEQKKNILLEQIIVEINKKEQTLINDINKINVLLKKKENKNKKEIKQLNKNIIIKDKNISDLTEKLKEKNINNTTIIPNDEIIFIPIKEKKKKN
jgi:hypothetical protein